MSREALSCLMPIQRQMMHMCMNVVVTTNQANFMRKIDDGFNVSTNCKECSNFSKVVKRHAANENRLKTKNSLKKSFSKKSLKKQPQNKKTASKQKKASKKQPEKQEKTSKQKKPEKTDKTASTKKQPLYVVKDKSACLLVVHVCRTVDRVLGHPRPSLAGIGVPTDVP